jgi:hypothetical protein
VQIKSFLIPLKNFQKEDIGNELCIFHLGIKVITKRKVKNQMGEE